MHQPFSIARQFEKSVTENVMILPSQGSRDHELKRRVVGCRERLRRSRSTQKIIERDVPAEQAENLEVGEVHELPLAGDEHTRCQENFLSAKDDVAA